MALPPKPFVVALLGYTMASAIGLLLASRDDASDKGTVTGGAVVALVVAAVLWYFASRGHRWPKWLLLILLVLAIGAQVAFLDLRSLLASLDVAALAVLIRGWSSIKEQEPLAA